ncbi:MAG: hypothetical protein ACRDNW_15735, partial [Trebonia sp.]
MALCPDERTRYGPRGTAVTTRHRAIGGYRPYSIETAFTGIWRLTERAVATFSGHLHIRYPDPVSHAAPRDLADGADVLSAFANAIDAALCLRPLD